MSKGPLKGFRSRTGEVGTSGAFESSDSDWGVRRRLERKRTNDDGAEENCENILTGVATAGRRKKSAKRNREDKTLVWTVCSCSLYESPAGGVWVSGVLGDPPADLRLTSDLPRVQTLTLRGVGERGPPGVLRQKSRPFSGPQFGTRVGGHSTTVSPMEGGDRARTLGASRVLTTVEWTCWEYRSGQRLLSTRECTARPNPLKNIRKKLQRSTNRHYHQAPANRGRRLSRRSFLVTNDRSRIDVVDAEEGVGGKVGKTWIRTDDIRPVALRVPCSLTSPGVRVP